MASGVAESRCSTIVIRNVTLSVFGSGFFCKDFILRPALLLRGKEYPGIYPHKLVTPVVRQYSFSIDEAKLPGKALIGQAQFTLPY